MTKEVDSKSAIVGVFFSLLFMALGFLLGAAFWWGWKVAMR